MKELDNKNITTEKSKEIEIFIRENLNVKYDYEKDEQPDIYSECISLLHEREIILDLQLEKRNLK